MDQIVEIVLEKGDVRRSVHKKTLCLHSKYFDRIFNGNFRKVEATSLALEDVSDQIFRMFQFWLYGQTTREDPKYVAEAGPVEMGPRFPSFNWLQPEHHDIKSQHYYDLFVDLFIFADKYDVPQLRDDIMTAVVSLDKHLIRKGWQLCKMVDFAAIHEKLPQSATIRRYITQRLAFHRQTVKASNRDCSKEWSGELMNDVLHVYFAIPQNVPSAYYFQTLLSEPCLYHEHKAAIGWDKCQGHQTEDFAFTSRFLRACMEEVYEVEKKRQCLKASER